MPSTSLRRESVSVRGLLGVVSGTLAALSVAESLLEFFVSTALPPLPSILADTGAPRIVETRQIEEGVATAHFTAAGARLTGEPEIPGAWATVVLGDSYIVAREVSDANTMGAWLERTARSNGVPMNVRQYGWRGASPGQYAAVAPAVIARWNPAAVIIPLSNDDLDDRAVTGPFPHLRIDSAGRSSVVIDPTGPPQMPRPGRSVLWSFWSAGGRRYALAGRSAFE